MIVADGKEEIPKGRQALFDSRIVNPGVIHLNDLSQTRIGLNSEPLIPQLIVHTVVDLVEPLYEGFLGVKSLLERVFFVVIGQTVATELTGQNVGDGFKKIVIDLAVFWCVQKGRHVEQFPP